jgi:hypothetical protein
MSYRVYLNTGTFSHEVLEITSETLTLHDNQMDCNDITAFSYGRVDTVNAIHGGVMTQSWYYQFRDKAGDTIHFTSWGEVEKRTNPHLVHDNIKNAIWECFGNRIAGEMIMNISAGKLVMVGKVHLSPYGVKWKHKPLFGKETEHNILWSSIVAYVENGSLVLQSPHDEKVKTSLSLVSEYNAHVLFQILQLIKSDPSVLSHIMGKRI